MERYPFAVDAVFSWVDGSRIGVSPGKGNTKEKMWKTRCLKRLTFCFNDSPGTPDAERAALHGFLAFMFSEPSKYEIFGE